MRILLALVLHHPDRRALGYELAEAGLHRPRPPL
jgi:hypothetical protein